LTIICLPEHAGVVYSVSYPIHIPPDTGMDRCTHTLKNLEYSINNLNLSQH